MNQTEYKGERKIDQKWNNLYKIAGIATITMLVIIPVQILVFSLTSIPSTIMDWFKLYQDNWVLGLIHQDFLYIINNVIVAIMYLAFYVKLKAKNQSLMLLALVLGLLGIAAYLASNRSFELMNLSHLYYGTNILSLKAMYLSAGQAVLVSWQGTAFLIYYILNGIALLLLSLVMLQSEAFGKKIAIIGLVAGILMIIPSTAGTIGLIFSLASLIPWYIFSILAAKKFFQFAKEDKN